MFLVGAFQLMMLYAYFCFSLPVNYFSLWLVTTSGSTNCVLHHNQGFTIVQFETKKNSSFLTPFVTNQNSTLAALSVFAHLGDSPIE